MYIIKNNYQHTKKSTNILMIFHIEWYLLKIKIFLLSLETAVVVQWLRAFASYAEGWVSKSQPRQT